MHDQHKPRPAGIGEAATSDPAAREQVLQNFALWLGGAPAGDADPALGSGAKPVAQELLAVLRRRGPRTGNRAGRRHRRHPWRAQLTLLIQEDAPGLHASRPLVVSTCDLSRGGFSFLTADYVAPNTIIVARFENLPGRPCVRTCVRHCSALAARLHRVGVEFSEILSGDFGTRG